MEKAKIKIWDVDLKNIINLVNLKDYIILDGAEWEKKGFMKQPQSLRTQSLV